MSSIWVYPGQGAQKANMLHDLPQQAVVKYHIEQACDVLQQNVLLLDQPEALQSTYSVQLCLYIAGVISSALLQQQGVQPDYVAGLSIGAWAAATVAGVISFDDGLKLVAKRGDLMQQAYPQGYGMTAIIGAEASKVEHWISAVHQQHSDVYLANINAANQIVISGSFAAMQQVAELAHQGGAIAKKLQVSVPSHCILLQKQAEELANYMQNTVSHHPMIHYLSGTSARLIRSNTQIMDDLAFNMSRRIHWENTVQAAWERGIRLQIEALPGTVLTSLAASVFKEGTVLSFQNTQLESLIIAMQQACNAA
ncbi:malonate decarboxylase subunit epsilon [Acinetobacter qingfengensis]|uniref:Malonyl CoA-acyl carrier protein transacylase n=1 Tax=Acinetobacter qingfengensis TaxID=1262585 RepID=A0A1E7R645_9GAMM|nr:malonate decarboxylase subunit epsilon [Acinetobacter qingfengensis]KAA8734862.1 malonate decarboxylase subunit epsilon [Acinetobacter qingfengensis]OEY94782.1 malonate decarboxylase subunit epsilon [Acinetobacter qingfengensis]